MPSKREKLSALASNRQRLGYTYSIRLVLVQIIQNSYLHQKHDLKDVFPCTTSLILSVDLRGKMEKMEWRIAVLRGAQGCCTTTWPLYSSISLAPNKGWITTDISPQSPIQSSVGIICPTLVRDEKRISGTAHFTPCLWPVLGSPSRKGAAKNTT